MPDRMELLQQINEVSFVVNDLTLYLDTHPVDADALDEFKRAAQKRRELLKTYAEYFEPLTMNCVCPETNNQTGSNTAYAGQKHWTWSDGPMPWEGGLL